MTSTFEKVLEDTSPADLRDVVELVKVYPVYRANNDIEMLKPVENEFQRRTLTATFTQLGTLDLVYGHRPPEAVRLLIAARLAARKAKNFKEADRIRDELLAKGVVLHDLPDGTTTWEVKR